jgi:hypothetical protein
MISITRHFDVPRSQPTRVQTRVPSRAPSNGYTPGFSGTNHAKPRQTATQKWTFACHFSQFWSGHQRVREAANQIDDTRQNREVLSARKWRTADDADFTDQRKEVLSARNQEDHRFRISDLGGEEDLSARSQLFFPNPQTRNPNPDFTHGATATQPSACQSLVCRTGGRL